ncbi:3535_t:CDS:10, partial [Racocetra fulgida]
MTDTIGELVKIRWNNLKVAPRGNVREFVEKHNGHTVITKILIANNGIAAVKEIRSIRKWAYEIFGDERSIEFTVMATPEDLKINAEYIRMADQYIEVPGGSNNNNYANVPLIVDIAERTGVHANPRLPEALAQCKNKIVFIGPPGSAMRSLGDKISSTIVAQSANVPTMEWSGSGINETEFDDDGHVMVPDDVFEKACVKDAEDGLIRANKIGFPVMIKASEGGGGKGIRKVENPENFKQAFAQVRGEVPGSPIFIMKLAGNARHLEVQVLADQYGNAISLFGRDCSVQRRHQKIIEEAPVTIANHDTFKAMEQAAVRLAKLVGYVSAGTVEYLYSDDDFFCFLELNPRLQVEHPTTEMVSGVNLPAAQLQIAMGIPLHQIRDIRVLYGLDHNGTSEIDFDFSKPESLQTQRKPAPKGHVIAVRITAENPDAGFKPSSGMVHELNFRSSTNVWGYFSVNSAGGLHEFADSQFGHIFAYGENRQQSRKNMIIALKELSIRGDFRTTVEYLIKLLETNTFEENKFTTGWLDTLISAEHLTVERPDKMLAIMCGAVAKAYTKSQESLAEYKRFLEKGQIPSKDILQTVFTIDFIYEGVQYKFTAMQSAPYSFILYLNGSKTQVSVRALSDGGLLVLLDGKSHTCYFREEVQATRLMIDGKTCLLEQENDPTQLRSPSPGKLVRFLVESGAHVHSGDAYAEIEVMKMYMPLIVTEDGVVQFIKQANSTLEAGDIIGILTLDDPSHVRHAAPYEGQLPLMSPPVIIGDKAHQRYVEVKQNLENILDGYDDHTKLQSSVKEIIDLLRNPELPYLEFNSVLSTLPGRIPTKLYATLQDETAKQDHEFPAKHLKQLIDNYSRDFVALGDSSTFTSSISPLMEYHEVEALFSDSNKREEEVILALRDTYKNDLDKVIKIVLSHSKVSAKNTTTSVSLKARELLINCQLPSYEERSVQMEQILKAAVIESHYGDDGYDYRTPSYDSLKELIDTRFAVFDVLPNFFYHNDAWISLAALEVYARRAYRVYQLMDFEYYPEQVPYMISWKFILQNNNPETTKPLSPLKPQSSPYRMSRVVSISDLSYITSRTDNDDEHVRVGVMISCTSNAEIEQNFPRIFDVFRQNGRRAQDLTDSIANNIINIALRLDDDPLEDEILKRDLQPIVQRHTVELREHGIKRVTIVLFRKGQYPGYFTFREANNFAEDQTIRHIEPAMAYELELSRLSKFDIKPCATDNRQIRVYYAIGKENTSDCRFFVRALAVKNFIDRHGKRLWRLRVTGAEARFKVEDPIKGNQYPLRVIINNVSGYVVKIETYQEVKTEGDTTILKSIGKIGSMHLQPTLTPYSTKEWLQPRRFKAHLMGTTYVYDFPELFRQAVRTQWNRAIHNCPELKCPTDILEAKELVIDEKGQLQEVDRSPGTNSFGMVAWMLTLFTPEYPRGRKIVVIANDITYQIGSFGPAEDLFFAKATELARKLGIPRVYLSANSGARIGLADEIINHFKVSWVDENNPSKGVNYLYLDSETYKQLNQNRQKSVIVEELVEDGVTDGLGVESLKGSGLIAGATSRAYEDIFTITLVTCRIGAYLVRLGQRTIQNEGQPIILTGASALNKVLGREVYTSNLQLGGTQIMYRNGVSHITAQNDLEGITKIIQWLSYIPASKSLPVPIFPNSDTWDREIDYMPPKGPYDPRWLITGKYESDKWISGFFDRNSFVETLGNWAKTVVVGRARLGGVPMGVIAVETRVVEHIVPADPANSESQQQVMKEAGQVWYPNSAYKTAQAINDFNKGEQLPLMIFANWRGFSGGQRDMFLEILKYGSYIVDALTNYKQPVFVYIVPNGELRGGAWVVVDPSINEDMMEMYADAKSRAGVLEPEGIVEIKYRKPQLLATMERLDETYRNLKKSLEDPSKTEMEKSEIKMLLEARENELLPVYSQIALQFADLHDTPGRMKAKNTIRKVLEWREARRFFYWRVRRRLHEEYIFKKLSAANPNLSKTQMKGYLATWFYDDVGEELDWEESDVEIVYWFDKMLSNLETNTHNIDVEYNDTDGGETSSKSLSLIESRIESIRNEAIAQQIFELGKTNIQAVLDGISSLLEHLDPEEKTNILKQLA